MTREEAIKILKAIRVYECYPKSASEETKEAIDMAIEALSAPTDIVHCKECKYSHMTYGGLCKYCDMWVEVGDALYLEGDFYCGFGKRREDG